MECLLDGGCPCENTKCPNHGNCALCIKRHVEQVEKKVFCMRDENKKLK